MRTAILACALLLTACDEIPPGTGPAEKKYDAAVGDALAAGETVRSRTAAEAVAIKHTAATLPPSRARDAINDSADIQLANTGAPRAEDEAAALRRANLTLAGERDAALADKAKALDAGQALAEETVRLSGEIVTLKAQKDAERIEAARVLAAKEQSWVIRVLVFSAIGSFALFGLSLYVSGPVLGARQGWPFAAIAAGFLGAARIYGSEWFGKFLVCLVVAFVVAAGFAVWKLWQTGQLEKRMRAAAQDLKDESKTLAEGGVATAKAGWAALKEHLIYRLPRTKDGQKSGLEKEIDRRNVAEGINAT